METSSTSNKDNPSLVDPATVSLIEAVDNQGTWQSPTHVEPPEKKLKKDKVTTSKGKSGTDKSVRPSESKSATETKIAELNQKWSGRFNRPQI